MRSVVTPNKSPAHLLKDQPLAIANASARRLASFAATQAAASMTAPWRPAPQNFWATSGGGEPNRDSWKSP